LVGAALSIAGASSLITMAVATNDTWKILSSIVYGGVLVLLYTFSTLYHSLQGQSKKIFQKLDHIAIYLLIAGTYTPFALISLHGFWGWLLLGLNWGLAIFGICLELWIGNKTRFFSLFLYLIMGWMILIAIKTLIAQLPIGGLVLLGTGGVLYTSGIVFYIYDEKIKHFHGIWHLFVLLGSMTHFFSIAIYLI
jgi:hemolysin III